MSKTNADRRAHAARRGLDFLYRFARDPANFSECGSDLVNFFNFVATRAADAGVRRAARRMGRERARRWRADNPSVPADAGPEDLFYLVFGADSADRLGLPDAAFKNQLRRALRRFPASRYLGFDPVLEPPPENVPDRCRCDLWNTRGRKKCRRCGRRLRMLSRYQVWYVALIRTYIAACYGLSLGAHYRHVLKWLPRVRPYAASRDPGHADFYDTVFAVTHVVYTLNDYDAHRLSPAWLPDEYAFLKENLRVAVEIDDLEMTGEFLDTLKSFGAGDAHPLVRAGTRHLLARQNPDGSWGATDTDDIYFNYHTTLCAVGGLLDYRWRGEGLSFPWLKPSLEKWARAARAS